MKENKTVDVPVTREEVVVETQSNRQVPSPTDHVGKDQEIKVRIMKEEIR